jgi:hypothetical protein
MVYGPDGTEYPSWEAAIAAGVTNPSYIKPATTTTANIPTYGYELARLMQQYGVASPTPPKTTDQSLINQYFNRLNAPMYQEPVGNALFNQYLGIGLGRLPAPTGPMTNFFPGQPVAPAGYRFDPVTATNVPVTAPGGAAEAGRITTGTPNIGGNQCPPGFNFDPVTRSCVPTPATGICPVGKVLVNGQCVDQAITMCPPGKVMINGVCQTLSPCPAGSKLVNGQCVPDTVVTACPPGQTRNAAGQCVPAQTDADAAWIAQSKSFTDDQWRAAIDEWVRSNPTATKAQADLRAQQLGVPERLIPYAYTAANYIDNPTISAGYAPATAQTQFVTPDVPTGPAGADLYKMFNENISYALDPRSLGGAGITENEAQQMWDLAKTLGLSVPQITEKVNVLGNMNMTDEQIADTIRRLAPNEAEDYFKMVKYKADGGLMDLARKYADGGKVEADPLMGMVKKYQQGGLNTSDAMEQLTQARANLRSTLEQLSAQEEAKPPSKAEMYFRLAAAFATPTKTGDFGESLGLAAQQMAEYKGEQREAQKAAQQQRRDLAVELAKLDYETAQSAYEKSVAAQNPQSEIGRRCKDFYGVGTADYAACMQREKELSDERAAAAAELSAGKLELDEKRADLAAQVQETKAGTLTAPEIALKTATETELRAANEALILFGNILENAEIAYTKSLPDQKDRLFAELTNPNDERVIATRTMEREVRTNLLGSLKAMFGTNPTDGDRVAAEATQGLDAISVEERKNAFESAFAKMQRQQEQLAERLALINQGLYRQIQEPTDGE